ncbi:MAG TPA: sulfite exporter TauE/SafE family protein [Pyrinomonadaceae bacterium]|nr:sulfite exporter TauE/SafE family protein [Pyrinomonadaceae bacterium]
MQTGWVRRRSDGNPHPLVRPCAGGISDLYRAANVKSGGVTFAGLMSGLLGIGSGALKVMATGYIMHIPLKVSSATSNFMIGVTAGDGALVFLGRGDVSTALAAPVALGPPGLLETSRAAQLLPA